MKQRHKVLGLLGALSVVVFLDRMAIAVAGPSIQVDLHLEPEQWGWILSAYVLANGLFEAPSGAMGDRNGQRGELTRIVTWWSCFTALTGWCRGFWQLAGARFFFGMGSAGAYPNAAGVIARWFPARERARSQGFVWAASRFGGMLAPVFIVPVQAWLGWRAVFWMLGGAGILWAVVWLRFFHNYPEDDPRITQEELAEIATKEHAHGKARLPWRRILRSRALWRVVLAYGCYGCASWFYFSWFPTWFIHKTGLTMNGILLTSLPFAMGVAGNLSGGVVSDRLAARWGAKRALRTIPAVCLAATAVTLVAMALCRGVVAATALSCLGFGVMDFMLPSAWAMCVAIGGRASGTATGMMNTAGQAGGFLCTVLFGYVVERTGSYNLPLLFIAGMVLVSALIFSSVDCTQTMDTEPAAC
ncbi:MAG: MFS transporter [Acidobacteriota bacterium]|nr:MFS transporter [Acidobacteriota bacterium]